MAMGLTVFAEPLAEHSQDTLPGSHWEKENAVEEFRKLIGATDPQKAEEGTIRKMYAENIQENIVHGSDSDENAAKEIAHFFTRKELLDINGF